MQLIQKPSSKPSGVYRKPILLDPSTVSALEKLAHDERVAAPVMVNRMIEQVLVSDKLAASFLKYVHDYWWGHKATTARSVHVLRVGSETFSLLLYLSSTSGFEQKTDQTVDMLISFYSQIAKTVSTGPRAMSALTTQY
jgi:hypothetical protein